MGAVKDQMKPSTPAPAGAGDDWGKDIFGKLKRKAPKVEPIEDAKLRFADMLERADDSLAKLIATKEAELHAEKGREDYNRRALALLRTMGYHLDEVINAAVDYSKLQ